MAEDIVHRAGWREEQESEGADAGDVKGEISLEQDVLEEIDGIGRERCYHITH